MGRINQDALETISAHFSIPLPKDVAVVAFLEQVVKDALVDAEKNNIVRFDEYMMFV